MWRRAMTERLLYPPELEPRANRDRFDPELEGSRHGLSRELSLALWERVRADATDGDGRCNMDEARRRFHQLAARLAARGARPQPAVGRTTRVRTEILGEPFDDRSTTRCKRRRHRRSSRCARRRKPSCPGCRRRRGCRRDATTPGRASRRPTQPRRPASNPPGIPHQPRPRSGCPRSSCPRPLRHRRLRPPISPAPTTMRTARGRTRRRTIRRLRRARSRRSPGSAWG